MVNCHTTIVCVYATQIGFPSRPISVLKYEADVDQPLSDGVVWRLTYDASTCIWLLNKRAKDGSFVPVHRIREQQYSLAELDAAMTK